MASGGARPRSGPPPDENAFRRDRASDPDWIHLPTSGRAGDPPAWPLKRAYTQALSLWTALWARPEAVMWETHGAEVQVALYVKAVMAADKAKATAADRRAALSFMDDLGLSEGGRRKNRWIIDGQSEEKVTRTDDPDRASAKARFRSIEGGAAS